MSYIGDFSLGDTFDTKFCTVTTTGAPTTLAGTPVVSAYVGNSLTQITAGITLTVDFDAVTGLHNVRVVASGANGYATASNYQLVITTGTVNSVSVVGYVIAQFSIEARSALRPATSGRTLVVDAAGLADANAVKVGPTGAGTAQTAGDLKASLNTIDDFIDTEVAAILVDTDDIQTRLPAALVGGRMDVSVGAMAADVVTAAAIAANAIGASELAQDAAQEIADEVLNRDLAGGASGNTRNVRNALRALRNKVSESGGTLTVTEEDDTTSAWTATVVRTAATDAITSVDPV